MAAVVDRGVGMGISCRSRSSFYPSSSFQKHGVIAMNVLKRPCGIQELVHTQTWYTIGMTSALAY